MRNFLFLLLAIAMITNAGMITPELQQAMNNSRGEFNIIVEMAEQFNVEAIKADNMIRSNDVASREIVYDILKAKAEVSQMAVNHLLNVRNVQRFWLVNAFAMTADAEIINKLAAEEAVGKIYLDVEEMMIDPQQSSEETRLVWGVEYIKTQAARDKGITGKGIVVAVVDTGVDLDHSGFAPGQVLVDQSKSFIDNEPTADDGNGHGTHCAGTIGSKGYGVAPDCKILPVKVLSAGGSGSWTAVMNGVQYAAEQKVDIMSMSLGGRASTSGNVVETAVKNAIASGVVCVIAAGNSGPSAKTIGTPGVVLEAITVGAINSSGTIASFSSRGVTVYNTEKPDIVAPGVNVPSLWKNGGTNTISGTSMATPHVAGLCALILQAKPGLTPAKVKALIMDTAFGTAEANVYGKGCVDAEATTK
ncbi:MAG TPA: S8 family serine peptidase [Planctomycetota bacterium]|nr:S8 family serine peptidase [Planctomycetota bacterium]HQB01246.1 S8 family serine peptidase [Planctomycetota bacterium]